jgi:beta-lactamase superfamily II metal-dependent hydrolase
MILIVVVLTSVAVREATPAASALNIYYVDVEGGAATLIVTPAGESILVDTGWPEFEGRDAKRIKEAMTKAGITAIDHLVTTHYHRDHYGGISELSKLVPIKRFYDHGQMNSLAEDANFPVLYGAYQSAAKSQTTTLLPGDTVPLKRAPGTPPIRLAILAADRRVLSGKGRNNPECASATDQPEDTSDNARSVAFLLSFGDFDFLDAGDLTWNIEKQLVCPTNRIGTVDLYQVTHHGANSSNNPVLLRSIAPTAAIMNNGPRKGGHPDVVKWLRELRSLQALFQVHRNVTSKPEENTSPEFIANLDEQPDAAHMITVTVDGARRTFTITNGRTNASPSFQFK